MEGKLLRETLRYINSFDLQGNQELIDFLWAAIEWIEKYQKRVINEKVLKVPQAISVL